jgi:solute:Na+ symporter, SSS family
MSQNTFTWILTASLILYTALMFVVGLIAQRKIHNVDDYIVAGRSLNTTFVTIAMIATWFGAESLMTATDQVAANGVRGAMLDPVGISICLVIAGIFIAGPLWRLKLLTIPDFFRCRYGKLAEQLSAWVLVPSYFGWIAAQYLALGIILNQFFQMPLTVGVISVAIIATSYSLMGGMWSVTWTDTIQLFFICVGLLVLGFQIVTTLGAGSGFQGLSKLASLFGNSVSTMAAEPDSHAKLMTIFSALVIGGLGNLPIQDLMQRICSSKSDRTARLACLFGAFGYLCIGTLPIAAGLAALQIMTNVPTSGVLMQIASQLLSPMLLILFLLAVVSVVLSTVVSAVLAPASILAQNIIQPRLNGFSWAQSDRSKLMIQRTCAVAIATFSLMMALSGSDTYGLVENSYSLSLVSLFVPFFVGLYIHPIPPSAAVASMVLGVTSWLIHIVLGWEYFLEPYVGVFKDHRNLDFLAWLPHELGDLFLSALGFYILWKIVLIFRGSPLPASDD